jgi:phospholipid/cholesterol/gamma-HCH transport system permease protein
MMEVRLMAQGVLEGHPSSDGALILSINGSLDTTSTGQAWRRALQLITEHQPKGLIVDASRLTYCDGAGAALLLELRRRQESRGSRMKFSRSIRPIGPCWTCMVAGMRSDPNRLPGRLARRTNRARHGGGLARRRRPDRIRWATLFSLGHCRASSRPRAMEGCAPHGRIGRGERAAIIMLLGFLLGLIMAFQSAIPMRQFGADIYVANLIGLSMLRELGPLLTAIILAGRSGSAFAAELGTMKVSEEIDALTTMGLEPVRFLVVPRVIAAVAMTPLLSVFAGLLGLIGGAVVMLSLGFPW